MIKRVLLVGFLLAGYALGQTVYRSTGTTTVTSVPLANVSVVTGTIDAYLIVVPNALLAAPDVTVGQAAFDACMAVTNSSLACEPKRSEAITNDIANRVKTLLMAVPDNTLTSLNLKRVE